MPSDSRLLVTGNGIVSCHDRIGNANARPREVLKSEMLRWHPDKFWQRFGARLAAEDRDDIMQRVKLLSQQINAEWHDQNDRGSVSSTS